MLRYPKPGFIRRTTSTVYRGGRRHVTKYVARAIYAGRQYSQYRRRDAPDGKEEQLPLRQKLSDAWRNTPTKWYPLPVFVGALLLVALNFRKRQKQEQDARATGDMAYVDRDGSDVVRLKGPLQVYVFGALPLRNLSRLWGYLNSFELPVWFRPFGFRVYSTIFGVNLDEVERDLKEYKSLGDFFYRRLKDGTRPIDNAILVSPADGKVLHLGTVEGSRVEQVKGVTYSLSALLGSSAPATPTTAKIKFEQRGDDIVMDQQFADINGIEYTLDQLLGSSDAPKIPESKASNEGEVEVPEGEINTLRQYGESKDASLPPSSADANLAHDAQVASAVRPSLSRSSSSSSDYLRKQTNKLFFAVVYLAPGDYHRFHAPASWVVERRRHFVGELFSVSPFVARRLAGLFVLNERVALLGRWAHGFFSMTPVGATNVGSILLDFDKDLRTNVRGRRPPPGTFAEAVYSGASRILSGKPLRAGEEMGGFCLGSTIVLVFEAPREFEFAVRPGERVKVGQRMGDIRPASTSDSEKGSEPSSP